MTHPQPSYMPQIVSARAMRNSAGPAKPQSFSDFMVIARKRFRASADASNRIRQEALEDLRFYNGEQWPAQIQSDRVLQNRPCLTINKLKMFARQILNAERESRPAIEVNPVGDGADVDTAEIIQGIMRHVEVASDAESVYAWAFMGAVIHGFGYWRVLTKYVSDESLDQDIALERIQDPFTVYFDPAARQPDRSDAKYCFIVEDIPIDAYREMYPDSQVASLADFRSIGDGDREWFQGGNVRIAEYFQITTELRVLVQLADGRTVDSEELEKYFRDDDEPVVLRQKNGQPMIREVMVPTVRWCKMNAREILEPKQPRLEEMQGEFDETVRTQPWPGKHIPVIPVLGEELIVDGKLQLYGIVRDAKDAQRQYNYARTGIVEQIALASKSPWLVEWSQIEGYEEWWRQANVRNFPFLPYRAKSAGNGQPIPPPIRNQWEPPVQAMTQSLAQSDQDLMATTGQFSANIGDADPRVHSGVAITALQRQGQQSNSNYMANLARSIRYGAKVILDLIPRVMDSARVVRIVRPDQTHEMVPINGAPDPNQSQAQGPMPFGGLNPAAMEKVFDVTTGRYDVTVSVGPSYQTRRQEFVQSVLSLVQAAPQTFQFVMDLLVRNMDWPGASEIADRLKKMLPQQLQEGEQGSAVPPEVQNQIRQLMAERAQLVEMLKQAKDPLTLARLNNASKERVALLNAKVDLVKQELAVGAKKADTMAGLEYDAAGHQLDLLDAQRDREHQIDLANMPPPQAPAPGQPNA